MRLSALALLAASALLGGAAAGQATTLLADTVIAASFGGDGKARGGVLSTASFPIEVPLSYATDGNSDTFVSLATGSYMVLGFSTGHVFDGDGDDLFIREVVDNGEEADIYVSEDFGKTFTFLTTFLSNPTAGIDLADFGFTGLINALKIVGKDDKGAAAGFDLAFVEGRNFRLNPEPAVPEPLSAVSSIPLPASLPLLGAGLLALGLLRRRRH